MAPFPADDVLIARGKYSTLGKDRRAQLERVQGICTSLITAAHAAMRDCEVIPPANVGPIATLDACMTNLKEARAEIARLCTDMIEVKKTAWPD